MFYGADCCFEVWKAGRVDLRRVSKYKQNGNSFNKSENVFEHELP